MRPLVLALALVALVATACGPPPAPEEPDTPVPDTPPPGPTDEPAPLPTNTLEPTPLPQLTATAASQTGQQAVVSQVIDGETIEVLLAGETQHVRYVGIDVPQPEQTCGEEALAANAALVEGLMVTLVKDASDVDAFGQLLRYVFVGDTFVNAELVAQGYAMAAQSGPDASYADALAALEEEAADAGLGCHGTGIFVALRGGGTAGESAPEEAPPPPSGDGGDSAPPPAEETPIPPTQAISGGADSTLALLRTDVFQGFSTLAAP